MEELVKKIDELKELMIASNVTHIMIDKYQDNQGDEVVDKFKISILQDDRNVSYRGGYSRPYSEYRRV